jgi:hypothetical protein
MATPYWWVGGNYPGWACEKSSICKNYNPLKCVEKIIMEGKPMYKPLEVGDVLEITMDGNKVAIIKNGGCLAEDMVGFGDTIEEALIDIGNTIQMMKQAQKDAIPRKFYNSPENEWNKNFFERHKKQIDELESRVVKLEEFVIANVPIYPVKQK